MPFFLNFLGASVEAAPSAAAGFLTTFLTGLGSDEPSAALGAAITKEWCDKVYGGHWCWLDLGFDVLGMASGIGLNLLLL